MVNKTPQTVYVGMSGGVDSSVTAALLKEQGYEVVGVYMKNWTKDIPGYPCPWKEDFQDAKRVAVQLGIDFKVFDFEEEYKQKVVDYMIVEYQAGHTPNPDIMCNQEVKFKLFLETSLEDGADLIATGHYARVENAESLHTVKGRTSHKDELTDTYNTSNNKSVKGSTFHTTATLTTDYGQPATASLQTAADANKDQTYFLYRVTEDALKKTLFPLGNYTKPEVRLLAKKYGLITATKKESMGICFVGKVGIKEFLQQYIKSKPGNIVDNMGKTIGKHDGAIFYTIGQRHGLDVGGGLPYYVVGKDMKKNEVHVTTDLNNKNLWSKEIKLTDTHWINNEPKDGAVVMVRTRHRSPLVVAKFVRGRTYHKLDLDDEVRALTPGQSAVIYQDDIVLGGGIIC